MDSMNSMNYNYIKEIQEAITPRLRCKQCKTQNSMDKPYGKISPCKFCARKNRKCKGESKMRCNICDCKYSEEF